MQRTLSEHLQDTFLSAFLYITSEDVTILETEEMNDNQLSIVFSVPFTKGRFGAKLQGLERYRLTVDKLAPNTDYEIGCIKFWYNDMVNKLTDAKDKADKLAYEQRIKELPENEVFVMVRPKMTVKNPSPKWVIKGGEFDGAVMGVRWRMILDKLREMGLFVIVGTEVNIDRGNVESSVKVTYRKNIWSK